MPRSTAPLRAYRASSEEDEGDEDSFSAPPSRVQEPDIGSKSAFSDGLDEEEEDSDEPEEEQNVHRDLQNISFGALAQAQAELASDKPQNSPGRTNHDRQQATDAEKINTLRDRLAELKRVKNNSNRAGHKTKPIEDAESTSKSTNSLSRSSKHAPAEQSSRHAVTRKRSVIDGPQEPFRSRDPRFSAALSSRPPNVEAAKRNYDFLKSYRDTELQELRDAVTGIKARKNKRKSKAFTPEEENEIQQLKRKINSIENRIKSETEKERLKDITRRHKKEERELVKQGKKPFYLKKSELKERALKEKFEGMKSKERDKAVQRRRKKLSHRERRAMPTQRRTPTND